LLSVGLRSTTMLLPVAPWRTIQKSASAGVAIAAIQSATTVADKSFAFTVALLWKLQLDNVIQ
jgi:type III secretory pathway component EscS